MRITLLALTALCLTIVGSGQDASGPPLEGRCSAAAAAAAAAAEADGEPSASLSLLQRGARQRQAADPGESGTWPFSFGGPLASLAKVQLLRLDRQPFISSGAGPLTSNGAAAEAALLKPVDCSATPALCSNLLRCDTEPVTPGELAGMFSRISTDDGRANLRTWCLLRDNELVQHCLVDRDPDAYSQELYDLHAEKGFSEYDASYCFSQGSCTDTAITASTPPEQVEATCDRRYPEWRSVGVTDLQQAMQSPVVLPFLLASAALDQGLTPPAARVVALAACATGSFHCVTAFCRSTVCKMDYYRQKYGHLQPKFA